MSVEQERRTGYLTDTKTVCYINTCVIGGVLCQEAKSVRNTILMYFFYWHFQVINRYLSYLLIMVLGWKNNHCLPLSSNSTLWSVLVELLSCCIKMRLVSFIFVLVYEKTWNYVHSLLWLLIILSVHWSGCLSIHCTLFHGFSLEASAWIQIAKNCVKKKLIKKGRYVFNLLLLLEMFSL